MNAEELADHEAQCKFIRYCLLGEPMTDSPGEPAYAWIEFNPQRPRDDPVYAVNHSVLEKAMEDFRQECIEAVTPARTQEEVDREISDKLDGAVHDELLIAWYGFEDSNAEFCAQLREMLRIIEEAGGCSE